jgi:hypothetical protein
MQSKIAFERIYHFSPMTSFEFNGFIDGISDTFPFDNHEVAHHMQEISLFINHLQPFIEWSTGIHILDSKKPANYRREEYNESHHYYLIGVHNCGAKIVHIRRYDSKATGSPFLSYSANTHDSP